MDASKSSNMSKMKFPHCEHKLIYFETFIRRNTICYIVQCETKQIFVGQANDKFQIISFGSEVKDKIAKIAYSPHADALYMGSTKGHIHYWLLKVEKQKEVNKIESIDGKEIIGLLAYTVEQQQKKHQIITAFTGQGIVRQFRDAKLNLQKSFPCPIIKIVFNKSPAAPHDVWCALFLKNNQFPYIMDLVMLKKMLKDEEDSITKQLQQYHNEMKYDADELQFMTGNPTMVALSNNSPLMVVSEKKTVTVFEIIKENAIDFKFQNEDDVEQIDLLEDNLMFNTRASVVSYNLSRRKRIGKNILIKGSTSYNNLRWAQSGSEVILGSTMPNSMKLMHTKLNIRL